MRKLSLLAIALLGAISLSANVLTPEQALSRARGSRHAKAASLTGAAPQLVYTVTTAEQPAVYVFEPAKSDGYMVLSADDAAQPILGYADNGSFDTQNIPDGLQYWLDFYASEIAAARAEGNAAMTTATAAAAERQPITPMIATRWNQGEPYNNLCPLVGSNRSVTGCVATAMAQVMKYHNWPEKGVGSNSYSWNGTTLSLDFSAITYDWGNMLDSYGTAATDAQKNAVATLMYSCGVSVNMNYSPSASGASSLYAARALVDNFNYDGSLQYLLREYYTLDDWEDEVYGSLAEGCPVLYGGQSSNGGHEFVCDGYSQDGFFHFNWGWGGMSDGYFKLTSLNPGSQGIGGAGSGAGYNFGQDIIVGIKPFDGQSAGSPVLCNESDFAITNTSAKLGSSITAEAKVRNNSFVKASFIMGISITSASGQTTFIPNTYNTTLELDPRYGYLNPIAFTMTLPSDLANGTYTVRPAYLCNESWHEMATMLGKVNEVTMTVADNTATFSSLSSGTLPQITSYSFVSDLYSGLPFTISGTIANTGDLEFYGSVYALLLGTDSNYELGKQMFDLQAGETSQFDFSSTVSTSIPAGTYQFVFAVAESNSYRFISEKSDITIQADPGCELTLGNVTFASGTSVLPKNDLGVKTSLTCTSGVYYGTLDMLIYELDAEAHMWRYCQSFPSEMLYMNAGDTREITYHSDLTNGTAGKSYMMMFAYGNKTFKNQVRFTLDTTTGIDGINADADIVGTELYNLQGIPVSGTPMPGHYIKVDRHSDGTTSTSHIIIR